MANIVVTSTASSIKVEYNDLAGNPAINTEKNAYKRSALIEVAKPYQGDYIIVNMQSGVVTAHWKVAHQATGDPEVLPIDSIDGTTPTTLDELYDLIVNLQI